MRRVLALPLALGLTGALSGCAPTTIPCPSDPGGWVSTTVRGVTWDAPMAHPYGQGNASCRSVVAGPLLSPDHTEVGWVEERADGHVFLVGGRPAVRLPRPISYLTLGLDGARTFHILGAPIQLFVHQEPREGATRWKGAIECPSCTRASGLTRYFDVAPAGPLEVEESEDGAFTFLTVPAAGAHARVYVLDSATPAARPTHDRYLDASDAAPLRHGVRVWLGNSEGPVLDSVSLASFTRDPAGVVRYEGTRGAAAYDVVDNVLHRRAPTRAADE